MRFFYVLYVRTLLVRQYLDLLRLLADPCEKRSAHITVRGPYDRRYDFSSLNEKIRGHYVQITGVDAFMEPGQSTIYLQCSAPFLEPIWHKPDYGVFNPHVTIYDGKDRGFARDILGTLRQCKWDFTFEPTELEELITNRQYSLELPIELDWQFVNAILGGGFTLEQLQRTDEQVRLVLMRRAARIFEQVWRQFGGNPGEAGAVAPRDVAILDGLLTTN